MAWILAAYETARFQWRIKASLKLHPVRCIGSCWKHLLDVGTSCFIGKKCENKFASKSILLFLWSEAWQYCLRECSFLTFIHSFYIFLPKIDPQGFFRKDCWMRRASLQHNSCQLEYLTANISVMPHCCLSIAVSEYLPCSFRYKAESDWWI